jgi:hypothetical protein
MKNKSAYIGPRMTNFFHPHPPTGPHRRKAWNAVLAAFAEANRCHPTQSSRTACTFNRACAQQPSHFHLFLKHLSCSPPWPRCLCAG